MSPDGRLPLEERLHQFVDELRARGLPVPMVERLDAARAVVGTDLSHPSRLHTALGATLVKDADHLAAFDEVFDLFFRTGAGARPAPLPPLDLDDAVREVLRTGSDALARAVAERAVTAFARIEPGRRVAGVLYEQWTLDGLRLDAVADGLAGGTVGADGGSAGATPSGGGGASGPGAGDVRAHAESLRRHVVDVIRARMVADRGPADVARVLRTPLPTDVDLSSAGATQLAEIERVVPALQRKLATTLLRRRRRTDGPLDVRATLRRAMATGGVPVVLVQRPPRPTRPHLVVLADVSGSVAGFAAFSIALVAAVAPLSSRLRTFVFVSDTVEVTDVVQRERGARDAARAVRAEVARTPLGSSTDYGRALTTFRDAVLPDLGHRTTVVVLGDARGNHAPARVSALDDVARRAGAVYWLNPEPTSQWGTGDSLAPVYAPRVTEMVSCRTVADLRRFVERLD